MLFILTVDIKIFFFVVERANFRCENLYDLEEVLRLRLAVEFSSVEQSNWIEEQLIDRMLRQKLDCVYVKLFGQRFSSIELKSSHRSHSEEQTVDESRVPKRSSSKRRSQSAFWERDVDTLLKRNFYQTDEFVVDRSCSALADAHRN